VVERKEEGEDEGEDEKAHEGLLKMLIDQRVKTKVQKIDRHLSFEREGGRC
jgi:hypothetical protein